MIKFYSLLIILMEKKNQNHFEKKNCVDSIHRYGILNEKKSQKNSDKKNTEIIINELMDTIKYIKEDPFFFA